MAAVIVKRCLQTVQNNYSIWHENIYFLGIYTPDYTVFYEGVKLFIADYELQS